MGEFSIWHLVILLVVVMLVFGTGKLPKVAGDLAQGIKNFKQAMRETPDTAPAKPAAAAEARTQAAPAAIAPTSEASQPKSAAARTEETASHS